MRLGDYFRLCKETQPDLTQTDMATRLGLSVSHFNELLATEADPTRARKRRTSPELAAQISARTNGVVTVRELLYPEGLPEGAVLDGLPDNVHQVKEDPKPGEAA
jgi:hypothetical protein